MEETLSPAQAEVNQLVENGLKALDDFLKLYALYSMDRDIERIQAQEMERGGE